MKPRLVVVGLVISAVVLWLFAAWATDMFQLNDGQVIASRSVFEQRTTTAADAVARCLEKNYSAGLSLRRARAPASSPAVVRLRNRLVHLVVEVAADIEGGSVVRVYKLNGSPLANVHRVAVQSCIPENAFPFAGDPRNRDSYRDAARP